MIQRTPDYWKQFHCLASACPRSCCIGWEVSVDNATAAYYRTVPGPFGDRLRGSLTEEDGERCFARRGRRCPFLDEDQLCEIYRRLGEEHTGATCRQHPRFTEEYDGLREISLAASCPAVADLLLGSRAPLDFPATGAVEPETPDPRLPGLLACRERVFAILRDRATPLRRRMAWVLLFCNEAQLLMDEEGWEELRDLCGACGELPGELPPELSGGGPGIFPYALDRLKKLEILEPDWIPLLNAAEALPGSRLPDWAGERLLSYFVFRYLLKAVTDGDLLSRAQFAVFSVLVIGRTAGAAASPREAVFRYCREIEHCQGNLDALQRAFCCDAAFDLTHFFQELALESAASRIIRL